MSVKFGGNSIGKVLFGANNIGKVYFGNTLVFSAEAPCLTFSSPNSFSLNVFDNTKHWDGTLEYSTNGSTWSTWAGTAGISAGLSGGVYNLLIRGINNKVITGNSSYRWVLTGSNITCTGNIENLLDYATVAAGGHPAMNNYCYYYMFRDCTGLTAAPALPATTLARYCYHSMFYGCTGLTSAPALPATTLATYCYYGMFNGCTGLTSAPALPATTLASYCYREMFNGCTSLTAAPALPATTLASQCYYYMFRDCSNFKVSSTQTGSYAKAWRIPKSGTISSEPASWNTSMLVNTGGTFKTDPVINTTYYVENDPVE
jgi:hypothetical protein